MLRYFRQDIRIGAYIRATLQCTAVPALDIGQYGEWDITEIGDPKHDWAQMKSS